jgi:hypothetical protein
MYGQNYAALGQWVDLVGRGGGGGGHGGGGHGGGGHGGRGGWGWPGGWGWGGGAWGGYGGYPYAAQFDVDPYGAQLAVDPYAQLALLSGNGGGFAPPQGFPFPARAAVVDAPLPTQANRDILPMSTGVPILPTQSAQITGRPQVLVFKIGRFVISNAGTAGGSADWIVNDIKIGNRSQFVQSGDVPGDLFATNAIDTFVRFESAQTAMDVVVVVTYIGLNESGCPFFGAMVGTAAV